MPRLKNIQHGLNAECSICGDQFLIAFSMLTLTALKTCESLNELFAQHVNRKDLLEKLNRADSARGESAQLWVNEFDKNGC
jgi:hypothetical protein